MFRCNLLFALSIVFTFCPQSYREQTYNPNQMRTTFPDDIQLTTCMIAILHRHLVRHLLICSHYPGMFRAVNSWDNQSIL